MGQQQLSWEEAQLKIDLAQQKMGGRHGTAQELLKQENVNKRIVDIDQAKAVSFYSVLYTDLCLHVTEKSLLAPMLRSIEEVVRNQMAIADKEDSRNEFIETKVAEATRANMGKGGGSLSISTDSGGSGEEG